MIFIHNLAIRVDAVNRPVQNMQFNNNKEARFESARQQEYWIAIFRVRL